MSQVDMFDVGLALIDDDHYYDIYTINHQFAESILLNKQTSFELRSDISLGQTVQLPEYEPVGRMPTLHNGLNVFSPNRHALILYCQQCRNRYPDGGHHGCRYSNHRTDSHQPGQGDNTVKTT